MYTHTIYLNNIFINFTKFQILTHIGKRGVKVITYMYIF